MGGVNKKPYVVNDIIVPRRIISLGAALNHRVVDAMHGGKLFRTSSILLTIQPNLNQSPSGISSFTLSPIFLLKYTFRSIF